jgi:hypothetical protein
MELFVVLVGLELLLLLRVRRAIMANRKLRDELRRCHADLAAALAHLSTFAPGFDIAAARRLVTRWPSYDTKKAQPPGREPTRLH